MTGDDEGGSIFGGAVSGFSGVYGGGGCSGRQDELRLRSGGVLHTSICQPLFARGGWIYDRFAVEWTKTDISEKLFC